MKCDTPFEKYSDLCDLFNEIFKSGNWGVTAVVMNNLLSTKHEDSGREYGKDT